MISRTPRRQHEPSRLCTRLQSAPRSTRSAPILQTTRSRLSPVCAQGLCIDTAIIHTVPSAPISSEHAVCAFWLTPLAQARGTDCEGAASAMVPEEPTSQSIHTPRRDHPTRQNHDSGLENLHAEPSRALASRNPIAGSIAPHDDDCGHIVILWCATGMLLDGAVQLRDDRLGVQRLRGAHL